MLLKLKSTFYKKKYFCKFKIAILLIITMNNEVTSSKIEILYKGH